MKINISYLRLDKIKKYVIILIKKLIIIKVSGMKKIPNICPSCGGNLMVTRLRCPKCGTMVEGEFSFNKLTKLSPEQQDFLLVFLKCRGSIKDIEKELGLSYPTVRNKLDELLISLGFIESVGRGGEEAATKRKEILEQIEKGEIKVSEAVKLLKEG